MICREHQAGASTAPTHVARKIDAARLSVRTLIVFVLPKLGPVIVPRFSKVVGFVGVLVHGVGVGWSGRLHVWFICGVFGVNTCPHASR